MSYDPDWDDIAYLVHRIYDKHAQRDNYGNEQIDRNTMVDALRAAGIVAPPRPDDPPSFDDWLDEGP